MSLKFATHAFAAGLAFAFAGCQESTTRSDVAEAREDLQEEQQDVAEAQQEAAEDVADAQHDADQARHESMKPVLENNATGEVAETQADANAEIRDEQKDVDEAAENLKKTEAEYQATQARDGFAKQADEQIKLADERIAQLEERHDNAEGAAGETIQLQIDSLKSQRNRVKEAVDDLKGEELMKWQDHQRTVQQEIDALQKLLQTNQ